jgi:putative transposase
VPGDLEEAITVFVGDYNYRRYREGLGDVTPYDVYTGRHMKIILKRKEAKHDIIRKKGL